MNNWYYVIIGFLLLIAGTLFSIYKELFWKVLIGENLIMGGPL
jgi:hypothetical protein